MLATVSIAKYAVASFSYRVAIRRNSFSFATARSTTLRPLYAFLSNRPNLSLSFTCSLSRIGITAWIPTDCSPLRMRSALYPLSAASFLGRRCSRRTTDASSGPSTGHSLRLPRVSTTCSTLPRPSVITCSLLPKPPRLRPKPWSSGSSLSTPFFPRSGSMPGGADTGGVGVPLGPVDQSAGIGLHSQARQHAFPGSIASPGQQAAMGSLPGSVTFGQISPGRSAEQHPEDAVDNHSVVAP